MKDIKSYIITEGKFGSKKAKWVADLIKELNPNTKYTAEDFEAD